MEGVGHKGGKGLETHFGGRQWSNHREAGMSHQ